MPHQEFDLLGKLERDVLDEAVSLATLLRTCLILAGQTRAPQLRAWATSELRGYPTRESVPEYRLIVAPILWDVRTPYGHVQTRLLNVQELPASIREVINEEVPLNQSIDQLEAMAAQSEAQGRSAELGVFGGDVFMRVWNQNPRGERAIRMCWSIDPTVFRGVLGQVRTALTEFVVELRVEVGDGGGLPSAEQTDEALRTAISITDSTVTIVQATTKNGDIMPEGPRTTIKDNKIKVSDVKGNVVAGGAHVTQTTMDTVDVAKIREFAALVAQIAPTLGFAPEEAAELGTEIGELQAAAVDSPGDRGRIRKALGGVLKVLGRAAASEAQKVVITMGDDLVREIGQDVMHQLPH